MREITRAELSRVVDELTQKASEVAEERIQSLENRILENFAERPELTASFGEPDFVFALKDAARAVASSGDEHTEQLLADLLLHRAETGTSSRTRLATSQAIKAAEHMSIELINGLTALWVLTRVVNLDPPNARIALAAATQRAETLHRLSLPPDPGWLDDAEVLQLLRTGQPGLQTRRPYREFLLDQHAPTLVRGIPESTFIEATKGLSLAVPIAVEHGFKDGYVRLLGESREAFGGSFASGIPQELEPLVVENGFGEVDAESRERWFAAFEATPALAAVAAWWDSLPYIAFTPVGEAVGFIGAKRVVSIGGVASVGELFSVLRGDSGTTKT